MAGSTEVAGPHEPTASHCAAYYNIQSLDEAIKAMQLTGPFTF